VPAMRRLRQLVESGFVGEVLSSRIVGYGRIWGATVEDVRTDAYLLDAASGATMLTIPVAHTLAALRDVLGDVTDVSAMLATRRREVRGETTAELLAMDAPDEVLIHATVSGGAPLSLHYTGGMPRGVDGFVWDIHGTEGDLRATAETGHTQVLTLAIQGARGDDRALRPLDLPNDDAGACLESPVPGNVARIYQRMAADLRHGSSSAPTFDDALALHRLIAAVEQSARERRTIAVDAPNRPLPAV
jgi:predicted dehydrogenase